MSEIMLHGVLNMPPELWNNDSPIDIRQRHSRYVQASKYIDELERELTIATEQRNKLVEALQKVVTSWDEATWLDDNEFESFREALQSLPPNSMMSREGRASEPHTPDL